MEIQRVYSKVQITGYTQGQPQAKAHHICQKWWRYVVSMYGYQWNHMTSVYQ